MSRLQFFAHAGVAVLLCAPALAVSLGQEPRAEATGPTGPSGPAAAVEWSSARPAKSESFPHVVLLRNGRILRGWARREGDSYILERPGAEIRLAESSVEMIGRTLEELYARRRRQLLPDDITGHLALAHWCLRQNLLDETRLELAAAMALEPNNVVAKQLLLRLEGRERLLEAEPPQDGANGEGLLEESPDEPGVAPSPSGAGPNGADDLQATGGPPYEWPTWPQQTVGEFTRNIQPLLINSCTTAGCHSAPGKEGFGLVRIRDPRHVTPEATEKNLRAVLEWINPDAPNNSELLAMAVLAHARGPRPPFRGLRGRQFDTLARWIASLESTGQQPVRPVAEKKQATAAFKTAMHADAAAPGRRDSNAGRRLPSQSKRNGRTAGGKDGTDSVELRKLIQSVKAEEGLLDDPSLAKPGGRTAAPAAARTGTVRPREKPGAQGTTGAVTEPLPAGDESGTIPDARTLGAPPRVAAMDDGASGGGLLPDMANGPAEAGARKSAFSSFLRRFNPFRRKR